jgi:site-specific recombinase XerD
MLGEVERKNPTEKNRRPYQFSRPECRHHVLHLFRHTYATMLGVQGHPARNIQAALGHSDLATTERYLAIVDEPEKVRKEFEAIGVV